MIYSLFVVSIAVVVVDDMISNDGVDIFNVSNFSDVIADEELDVDVIIAGVAVDAVDVYCEADCAGVTIDAVDVSRETDFAVKVADADVVRSVELVAVGLFQEN